MKRLIVFASSLLAGCLIMAACGGRLYSCTDALGCVEVKPDEAIKIGVAVTLSGPDSVTGIDSLRGIEIAVYHQQDLLGHPIELIKADERCEAAGGEEAATTMAANPQIVGVIGTSCSSAGVPAARILSDAGMVLISPSNTAPSLTDPATHQPGYLRTIFNDKAQGKVVAEFAYSALGVRTMATVHDSTPYSSELQKVACEIFQQLGGRCIAQVEVDFASANALEVLLQISALNPDALYYPLYNEEGALVTQNVKAAGLENAALITSDGLLNDEFFSLTGQESEGMYFSGPSVLEIDPAFLQEYRTRYGEDPIDVLHAQAYDAAMMLFAAIEKVAVKGADGTLYIPRQALREALYATKDMQGLSGVLTCSPDGDCAYPNIQIYQKRGDEVVPIYP